MAVVLTIAAMLALNSLFAAYELALASVRVERLKILAQERRAGAAAAVTMKSRMATSLAVIQLGITLVGAIAAATGGASAEETIAPRLVEWFGIPERWSDVVAITLVVIPLSAITIVVGELIPKVFAIAHAERVTLALSPAMKVFSMIAFPAAWVLEHSAGLCVRLLEKAFPAPKQDERQVALQELRAHVALMRASKAIGPQEERIILQASRLQTMMVKDIMIDREDIVMTQADAPLSVNLVIAHHDLHTRFPVTEKAGDPDSIIGYVTFKEMMMLAKTHPGNPNLREITRPLMALSGDLPLSEALRRMLGENVHLALARNEDKEVIGIVTQEDVFEELFGEIEDEFDRLPKHIVAQGHQWVAGGGASLGRLRTTLQRPEIGENLPATTTLSQWVNHGRRRRLRGGDSVVVDGVWVLVRKVRRRQVSEALLDPEGNRYVPSVFPEVPSEEEIPMSGTADTPAITEERPAS